LGGHRKIQKREENNLKKKSVKKKTRRRGDGAPGKGKERRGKRWEDEKVSQASKNKAQEGPSRVRRNQRERRTKKINCQK